ncbi:MAG: hypothetical protein ACKVQK_31490 [Burkholderiales bacterium]
MLKSDLLKLLENLKDDENLTFALFVETKTGYKWQLLNPTIRREDSPFDVIGLTTIPFKKDTLQEFSEIKK